MQSDRESRYLELLTRVAEVFLLVLLVAGIVGYLYTRTQQKSKAVRRKNTEAGEVVPIRKNGRGSFWPAAARAGKGSIGFRTPSSN